MLRLVFIVPFLGLPAAATYAERRVALIFGADKYRTLRHLDHAAIRLESAGRLDAADAGVPQSLRDATAALAGDRR